MLAKNLQAAAGNAVPTDPQFPYVTLLLHGDGTNGAQNNTFLDASANAFTITRNGNTTQGSFSPYGDNWSNYFDGASYLQLADSTAWDLSADYTIEMWLFVTSTPNSPTFFQIGSSSLLWYLSSSTKYLTTTGGLSMTASTALNLNTWNHIAISRSGSSTNNTKMYLNGVKVAETTNNTSFTGDASNGLRIGAEYTSGFYLNGYASNVRVVKGTAVYTGDSFTVPTTPLTAITNTQLLTCQGNRFKDASANNFTLTVTGSPSVQRFSPFAPTAEYDAATIGGSGYFDGTGDYLTAAGNAAFAFGTGNFTVELWLYASVSQSDKALVGNRNTGGDNFWLIKYGSNGGVSNSIAIHTGSTQIFNNIGTITPATWNHIAWVRSGTTNYLYINGTLASSTTTGGTFDFNATTTMFVARDGFTGQAGDFNGYIQDVRLVKGTAVYTSNFTPPTAPLTAITNTSLLLNMTNAGIYDNAMMNDLETVGNAQVSTTQKKFGTGSMAFDGTGDYLMAPSSPVLALGTGDFTCEGWVRFTSLNSGGSGIFQFSSSSSLPSDTLSLACGASSQSIYAWNIYANDVQQNYNGTVPSLNTWYHFAVVRSSGTTKLYVNGTSLISVADTKNYSNTYLIIGGYYSTSYLLNGYIDDLRITKGVARYTSNFTPPAAAFPNT